jgi:uncharacterized protein
MMLPVQPAERIELLDILRGFALFGILLVNFDAPAGELWPALDSRVVSALDFLVYGTFYPLFSLLFGLGFAIQLMRAREARRGTTLLFVRRLAGLFIIGTAHAVLLWNGDILFTYAFLGLLLIPLQRLPIAALAVVALLLLGSLFWHQELQDRTAAGRAAPAAQTREAELATGLAAEEQRISAQMRRRSADGEEHYSTAVLLHWHEYGRRIAGFVDWPNWDRQIMLLMFVTGMLVGRVRLFEHATANRLLFGIMLAAAALLWAGAILYGRAEIRSWWGWGVYFIANVAPMILYVSAITLLVTQLRRARTWLGYLAPVGRTALSNYLLQSVAMQGLFASWALGLTKPAAALQLLVCCAFFCAVQVPLSHWWIARFRYGPAEWAWRFMTYGSAPRFRHALAPAEPHPAPAAAA